MITAERATRYTTEYPGPRLQTLEKTWKSKECMYFPKQKQRIDINSHKAILYAPLEALQSPLISERKPNGKSSPHGFYQNFMTCITVSHAPTTQSSHGQVPARRLKVPNRNIVNQHIDKRIPRVQASDRYVVTIVPDHPRTIHKASPRNEKRVKYDGAVGLLEAM